MGKKVISIVTDIEKFQDRVDEITSANSYESIKSVISDIKRALYDNRNSVALCAPQIGENLRLFVVNTAGPKNAGESRFKVFLNPLIVSSKGMHLSRENNLSIPDKEFIIPRRDEIHVAYQTTDGHIESETYKGAYAEIVQQMIEMLDGITLEDYGLEIDSDFDKASQKDKETIIRMYLEKLKIDSNNINTEIENNPELKEMNDTIKFMSGVLAGDIKPVDEEGNIVDFSKKENK